METAPQVAIDRAWWRTLPSRLKHQSARTVNWFPLTCVYKALWCTASWNGNQFTRIGVSGLSPFSTLGYLTSLNNYGLDDKIAELEVDLMTLRLLSLYYILRTMNCVTVTLAVVSLWTSSGGAAMVRQSSCNQICETGHFEIPVCGTDGILYSTMCEYERAKCNAEERGTTLNIHSMGVCITLNTTCDEISDPNFKCVRPNFDLVCASNNLTYDNPCVFMQAKCHNNKLDFVHTGPCNFDTTNAKKLDCGMYMTNTTNIAFEDGSIVEPDIQCETHPTDYICLLGGVTYHGACRYCLLLRRQGQINIGNMQVYFDHVGRCTHHIIG